MAILLFYRSAGPHEQSRSIIASILLVAMRRIGGRLTVLRVLAVAILEFWWFWQWHQTAISGHRYQARH
jgi:hypothetical protein